MQSDLTSRLYQYHKSLDCVHTMPAHFENGEKFDGKASRSHENGPFCRQILKTVDFENGTLTITFWKRHRVNT